MSFSPFIQLFDAVCSAGRHFVAKVGSSSAGHSCPIRARTMLRILPAGKAIAPSYQVNILPGTTYYNTLQSNNDNGRCFINGIIDGCFYYVCHATSVHRESIAK